MNISTRLSKLEAVRGERPIFVTFTDIRGQAHKMSTFDLIGCLREQISLIQFEARGISHTIKPEAEVVSDEICIVLIKQLREHLKYAGDKTQRKLIDFAIETLKYLFLGYMQVGEHDYYLLSGDKVRIQGDKICVIL